MKRPNGLVAVTLLLLVFVLVEARSATAQGRRGTLTYSNASYEGDIRNGTEHGRGTMSWDNGQRYEGDWRDGKMHGHGTYTWPNGNRYEGDWRNNQRTGGGIFTWPDGHRYTGDFRNGRRTGQGTYTWPDGSRYTGEFHDNKAHGRGTRTWPNGHRCQGDWRDAMKHGRGTYTWPNGNRYEGDWRDDQRTGQGAYTWPNGARYVGAFRNGEFHGRGTYTWPNGNRYEGDWRNDEMHGRGTMIRADGHRYQGEWRNGRRLQTQQRQRQAQQQERNRLARERHRQAQEQERQRAEAARRAEARKAARQRDLYGSIVFSQESEGGYAWGISWNYGNHSVAKNGAVTACRGRGGKNCAERLWFRNGCGALFIGGTNGWGAGAGDSTSKAVAKARTACESSNTNCRLAILRCTSALGASPVIMVKAGSYEPSTAASAQRVAEAEARRQAEAQERQKQERERQRRVEQERQKERNRLARERHRQAQRQAQERQRQAQRQVQTGERQSQDTDYWRDIERRRRQEVAAERQGVSTADRARGRDQWDAIATGKFTTGGHFLFTRKAWGVSHGWKTRDEAEAAAEKACYEMVNEFASNSAAICTEKVVFNNECGALFDGVAFEAGGTGPTKQHAVVVARQNCDGRNIGGGCHLLASHCSPPQPDRQRRAGQNRQVGARGDLYGSIVFSQEPGGGHAWGMAWNDGGRAKARQRAVAECQNRGGSSCGEIQWFRNACGALFRGDGNGWGTGWGVTKTDAESMARAYCESHNRNCRLEVSRCVDQPKPERQRAMEQARQREAEERKRAQERQRQAQQQRERGRERAAVNPYWSIVYDARTGYWGQGWDKDSPRAATRKALTECQSSGGTNCLEIKASRSPCGALAFFPSPGKDMPTIATAFGRNRPAASKLALRNCRAMKPPEKGGPSGFWCRLLDVTCSDQAARQADIAARQRVCEESAEAQFIRATQGVTFTSECEYYRAMHPTAEKFRQCYGRCTISKTYCGADGWGTAYELEQELGQCP